MKNILIGNGLNLTNYKANSFLTVNNVYNRFIENLNNYWELINKLFYLDKIKIDDLILELKPNVGIEILAGIVFQYVYNAIICKRKFTMNDTYRLVEILGEISIKSLFFYDNIFLIPKISEVYKNKIESNYRNIFTLNYIEDWDKDSRVKYLHGNLKNYLNMYEDIGSDTLSYNKEYFSFKKNKYTKIDFKDIVFMPTNEIINKNDYIVDGLYPSDDLYPADDLFPYDGRDIYKELDKIENLDVFGMSPYGDEEIIKKIKNIRDKKIYIYKLIEKRDEIEKWNTYGIDGCFIDSSEFLNN